MAKTINITFNKGIQYPPKLGTLILKEAGQGKLAYAQNVDSFNDEYGYGVITPGPALTTITNNSQLTGVPFVKCLYSDGINPYGFLYFAQGLLGSGNNVIRRVTNVISGQTPSIDTTGSISTSHSGHSNVSVVDMVFRPTSLGTNNYIYVAGKDNTDTWIDKFNADTGSPSLLGNVATNTNFTSALTDQFLVLGSDNNIYWIGKNRVSSIDTADNYTVNALANGLPLGTNGTCGVDWNTQLVVAYSSEATGDFTRRKSVGKSGIILWDYVSSNFSKNVPAPCRYISAIVTDPEGNLLIFGGVDEGKSSIYSFNGYGFNLIYSYIGDLPHSRHSVDFDGQGRLMWVTVDGQLCRLDRKTGQFDHLATIVSDSGAGGLLARSIGTPIGDEFLSAAGTGSTYTMKRVQFGNYIGDGAGNDGVTTPLAVSGLQILPHNSTITRITWHLTRPLATGEKVILQVYQNGSFTATTYSTLDYTVDGAVSGKRETLTLPDLNNFSLGVIWKMTDGNTTAPAVINAEVEYS